MEQLLKRTTGPTCTIFVVIAAFALLAAACGTSGRQSRPSLVRLSESRIRISVPLEGRPPTADQAKVALCTSAWSALRDGRPLFRISLPPRASAGRLTLEIETFAAVPAGASVFMLGGSETAPAVYGAGAPVFDAASLEQSCVDSGFSARAD